MSRSSVASGMTAVSIGDGRFSTSWKYTNHLSSCSFSVFSSVPCLSLIGPPVLYLYTHSLCDLVYSPLLSPYCRLLYLGHKLVHGFSLVSALANFDSPASFCCFQYTIWRLFPISFLYWFLYLHLACLSCKIWNLFLNSMMKAALIVLSLNLYSWVPNGNHSLHLHSAWL